MLLNGQDSISCTPGRSDRVRDLLDGLLGAIGFLTTLPAGKSDRLMQLQKHTYLFSVVGILVGLIIGAVATVLTALIPDQPGITAVLVIISIYILTGFNHLDALSDFGDGITAHGSREKKINALKDKTLGTGGVAFIVLYILTLFVIIQTLTVAQINIWPGYGPGVSLLVAEVASRHSMLTVAHLGRPIHRGMGSIIADNTGSKQFSISFLISASVCTVVMGIAGLSALVMAMLFSIIVVIISNRHFGGINGDCLGASNEIGRLIALFTIFIFIIKGGMVVWMPW